MKAISVNFRVKNNYSRLGTLIRLSFLGGFVLMTNTSDSAPFANGGFELPKLPAGTVDQAPKNIPGWDVSKGEAALASGSAWGAYPVEGSQHLAIGINDSSHGNTVSQTFDTARRATYKVDFQAGWCGNPSTNPGKNMRARVISAANEELAALDAEMPTAKGYGPINSFTFVATTDATTLTFLDTSSTAFQSSLVLDNVSVDEVFPHAATATATVVNGFMVIATVTDGGLGYTNIPSVRIIGGGGSGATAIVTNVIGGRVTGIRITNPGTGYTSTPVIVIAPPFIPQPTMGIAAMSQLSFTSLAVGTNYQLQSLVGGILFNVGALFTATNSTFTQLVSGTASTNSYRLTVTPAFAQAQATAQVVNGFVVGYTVTSGGSGYTTSPAVIIRGGGGSNATANAIVIGGSVTRIDPVSPGSGYTNVPSVIIALPPSISLWPDSVTQVMNLQLEDLSPYDNYQLEFAPLAGGTWSNWGGIFTPTSAADTLYINVTGSAGFFRVRRVP